MPGASKVTVAILQKAVPTRARLTITPVNKTDAPDEAAVYSGQDEEWNSKTVFEAKPASSSGSSGGGGSNCPDGADFVFSQPPDEAGRRYYGFRCEVVGTAVGKPLPFIADLQDSLTYSLSNLAIGPSAIGRGCSQQVRGCAPLLARHFQSLKLLCADEFDRLIASNHRIPRAAFSDGRPWPALRQQPAVHHHPQGLLRRMRRTVLQAGHHSRFWAARDR